jgi:hypothetical protein
MRWVNGRVRVPTDTTIIANALPGLERDLRHVREDLGVLEQKEWRERLDQDAELDPGANEGDDSKEWIAGRLAARLEDLARFIGVVLEAAGLSKTHERFLAEWKKVEGSLTETKWYFEVDSLDSPAFSLVHAYVQILKELSGGGLRKADESTIARIEGLLQSIPYLVSRRGLTINKEEDLQKVLDEEMALLFVGKYERKPAVGGIVKSFTADGGVRSEGALIELKYARDDDDVKRCIEELAADVSGYRGSADWRYCCVGLFTRGPLLPQTRLRAELERLGASDWRGYSLTLPEPPGRTALPVAPKQPKPAEARPASSLAVQAPPDPSSLIE